MLLVWWLVFEELVPCSVRVSERVYAYLFASQRTISTPHNLFTLIVDKWANVAYTSPPTWHRYITPSIALSLVYICEALPVRVCVWVRGVDCRHLGGFGSNRMCAVNRKREKHFSNYEVNIWPAMRTRNWNKMKKIVFVSMDTWGICSTIHYYFFCCTGDGGSAYMHGTSIGCIRLCLCMCICDCVEWMASSVVKAIEINTIGLCRISNWLPC